MFSRADSLREETLMVSWGLDVPGAIGSDRFLDLRGFTTFRTAF
jgi:hypothetical protein